MWLAPSPRASGRADPALSALSLTPQTDVPTGSLHVGFNSGSPVDTNNKYRSCLRQLILPRNQPIPWQARTMARVKTLPGTRTLLVIVLRSTALLAPRALVGHTLANGLADHRLLFGGRHTHFGRNRPAGALGSLACASCGTVGD